MSHPLLPHACGMLQGYHLGVCTKEADRRTTLCIHRWPPPPPTARGIFIQIKGWIDYARVRDGRKPEEGRRQKEEGGRTGDTIDPCNRRLRCYGSRLATARRVLPPSRPARPSSPSTEALPSLRARCRNHYPKLSLRSFWTECARGCASEH